MKDKKKRKELVDEAVEFAGLQEFVKFRPESSPAASCGG